MESGSIDKHQIRDRLKDEYCTKLERYKKDLGFTGKQAVKKLKYIAQNYLKNKKFNDEDLRIDLKNIMAKRIYHICIVMCGLQGINNIELSNWENILSRLNFYNEGEEGQILREFLDYLKEYFRQRPNLHNYFKARVTATRELCAELLHPRNMQSLLEEEINYIKNSEKHQDIPHKKESEEDMYMLSELNYNKEFKDKKEIFDSIEKFLKYTEINQLTLPCKTIFSEFNVTESLLVVKHLGKFLTEKAYDRWLSCGKYAMRHLEKNSSKQSLKPDSLKSFCSNMVSDMNFIVPFIIWQHTPKNKVKKMFHCAECEYLGSFTRNELVTHIGQQTHCSKHYLLRKFIKENFQIDYDDVKTNKIIEDFVKKISDSKVSTIKENINETTSTFFSKKETKDSIASSGLGSFSALLKKTDSSLEKNSVATITPSAPKIGEWGLPKSGDSSTVGGWRTPKSADSSTVGGWRTPKASSFSISSSSWGSSRKQSTAINTAKKSCLGFFLHEAKLG